MGLMIFSVSLIFLSGCFALMISQKSRMSTLIPAGGVMVGCLIGLLPVVRVLVSGTGESFRVPWQIPFGSFFIAIDSITAWFLVPILVLSAICGLYGIEYLEPHRNEKRLGVHWFFYNLLVAAMILVVLSRNGLLFLMAWELMSLASFFLVIFEDKDESVSKAGWIYLIATHLGTGFLLVFFILLGPQSGSLDFDKIGNVSSFKSNILFLLAVVGFGTKAGFVPFHVWLPEAHPAAPSHVSALMSGVMIKTGIYGLIRTLTFLDTPPAWWGWLLIGIGVSSGLFGIIFALAQQDLKRLLAYSSVENIGIITMGIGLGVLGFSIHSPTLCVLGFAGAFFHLLNHAAFKGLLFLGAGAVLHSTGTRQMDRLGGLLKRMPWSGFVFLIGAVAICGLPPLNGFAGEFMIYLSVFQDTAPNPVQTGILILCVAGGLSVIGGLALACFTKAFGTCFLGEPRSQESEHAHEAAWGMRTAMVSLAMGCVCLGLFSPYVLKYEGSVIRDLTQWEPSMVNLTLTDGQGLLGKLVLLSFLLVGCIVLLALLRKRLLSHRTAAAAVTWSCGYAKPASRMQYTASSFSQPLVYLFHLLLRTRNVFQPPRGSFPDKSGFDTKNEDLCKGNIYDPVFTGIAWITFKLRWFQSGILQFYVLYIALTLLVLLIWNNL